MDAFGSSLDHTQAVVALLTAAGLSAYISRAPDSVATPYVVVHPEPGDLDHTEGALASPFDTYRMGFQVTSVADGPELVQWLVDKVNVALAYTVPTISGRICRPILPLNSQPIRPDDYVPIPVYIATAQFVLRSQAA